MDMPVHMAAKEWQHLQYYYAAKDGHTFPLQHAPVCEQYSNLLNGAAIKIGAIRKNFVTFQASCRMAKQAEVSQY
jgi:hypothetical protein